MSEPVQRFLCREHGLGVVADEDGCCVTCGGDCATVAVLVPFPDGSGECTDLSSCGLPHPHPENAALVQLAREARDLAFRCEDLSRRAKELVLQLGRDAPAGATP